ncbi:MAG: phage terminase large subunit [Nitrosopumilus sp.]|nr:phage terminase large subunit [Nitrosopumilus sp.]
MLLLESLQQVIDGLSPASKTTESYQDFCIRTSPINNDGTSWIWDWKHQLYLYPYLERILSGDLKQVIFSTPPRHSKTETITIRLAAKFLVEHPDKRVIIAAYNQTRANKFSRKIKAIVAPLVALSKDRKAVNEWDTMSGGGLLAVGVGGGVTGEGGDLVLIDDPVKNREEADSKIYQEKIYDWFTDDLFTRLEPDARLVITMTRWNYSDLVGKILDSEDAANYTVINLPAIAEKDDPLGRAEGEALCPDRYPIEKLLKLKTILGKEFAGLFQGKPIAEEGAIFKRSYWNYYDQLPKEKIDNIVISWDTAFKKGASNDYSVGVVFIKSENKIYVVHVLRKRCDFPELKREFLALVEQYNPFVTLIEDKASGQSLIQDLKDSTLIPVKAVKADTDKEARANAVSTMVETGNVLLPKQAHWLNDFVEELERFPRAPHDDQVDAFVHGLNYLRDRTFIY